MLLFFNLTFLSRILNHDLFISEIFLKFTYSCNFSEKLSICVKKLFVVVVSVGKSQIDKLSNRWRACEEKRKKAFLCGRVGSITEDDMITGCHILYQLHGFFWSLRLDLPTSGGVEQLWTLETALQRHFFLSVFNL